MSLAVFPLAFTRYLMFFFPDLDWIAQTLVKCLFVAFLILTNTVGVKAAGRTNDVLTIVKLAPLVFFSAAGLVSVVSSPYVVAQNYSPFVPFGFSRFGEALVLIFWAYAGFEISTIPAEEIEVPCKTIPKAIVLGISIVTIFYLTTNMILFGVRSWTLLADDTAPLASATVSILSSSPQLVALGSGIVGIGALISVAGSDESGMLGTSRLGYALAVDGLFPHPFAKLHPRFKTPYLGIIVQALTALMASIVGGLNTLIATSVFFMAIAYAATSASFFALRKRNPKPQFHLKGGPLVAALGLLLSLFLMTQCTVLQVETGYFSLLLEFPYTPNTRLRRS